MKYLILACLLALMPYTYAQVSIAAGADVAYDAGRPMVEVRYFGQAWEHWSVYAGNDRTVGGDLYASFLNLQLGFGIEYANPNNFIDTQFAYALRLEYKIDNHWSIGARHRSNCRTVCDNPLLRWARMGSDYSKNSGLNYLFIRRKF